MYITCITYSSVIASNYYQHFELAWNFADLEHITINLFKIVKDMVTFALYLIRVEVVIIEVVEPMAASTDWLTGLIDLTHVRAVIIAKLKAIMNFDSNVLLFDPNSS